MQLNVKITGGEAVSTVIAITEEEMKAFCPLYRVRCLSLFDLGSVMIPARKAAWMFWWGLGWRRGFSIRMARKL